ncbi:MAG: hypothetical protein V2J20_02805 [Wenzhouxiangella sp.]|nr:hypothetical protein [Wenzhouxiangella sp.]
MSEAKGAPTLMGALLHAKTLLADKGHDANRLRETLQAKGVAKYMPARREH